MAKAITVEQTRIHCDTCHHEFEGSPPEWHNKACPECQASPIISDTDIQIWKRIESLRAVINALAGDVSEDAPTVSFTLDTKPNK